MLVAAWESICSAFHGLVQERQSSGPAGHLSTDDQHVYTLPLHCSMHVVPMAEEGPSDQEQAAEFHLLYHVLHQRSRAAELH